VVFFTTRDLWQMGIKQSDLCCLIEYPAAGQLSSGMKMSLLKKYLQYQQCFEKNDSQPNQL